jgi:hypothetical protein
MNRTVGPGQGGIGPSNSFLTVKNTANDGNSKNNNKAYMQHIKSADEVINEKRVGVDGGGAAGVPLGNKSDATTAAETSHAASSMNHKSTEAYRQ